MSVALNQLKIRTKITLSFAAILVLLLVLSGYSLYSTDNLKSIFFEYWQTSQQSLVANDVLEDLMQARLDAFRFGTSYSEDAARSLNIFLIF